jgi:hypothetical protein
MTPQDHLYRLIQAMTRNEKQAFTTMARKSTTKTDPTYLKLFKSLSDLEEYEEKKFLASPKGKPFAANYAVRKTELYEKILLVLRAQRQSQGKEKSIEFKVRECLEDARLLQDKSLHEQANRRLDAAWEDACKYQLSEAQLEILRMRRALRMREPNVKPAHVQEIHAAIAETVKIIQNKARMLSLLDPMFLLARQNAALNGRIDHALLDEIIAAPELQDVSSCLSFEANQNYHFCHAIYHQLKGNLAQAWIHGRAIYLAYQEEKEVRRVKGPEYRNVVNNYLAYCVAVYRFDDFDQALEHLVAGPFHSKREEDSAIHNALAMRLTQALNLCDWKAAAQVRSDYRTRLKIFSEELPSSRMMLFYLSFSRLSMVEENWPDAIKWAKKVLSEGDSDPRQGLVFQAQLQELIALYENADIEDLERRKRAIGETLKRAELQGEFERKVLSTMQRLPGLTDPKAKKNAFLALEKALKEASPDMLDAISLTSAWVQSHLRRIPLAQVFEEIRDNTLAALPPIP